MGRPAKGPTKHDDKTRDKRINKNERDAGWEFVTCPTCSGSGKYGNHNCGLCGGSGTIKALK